MFPYISLVAAFLSTLNFPIDSALSSSWATCSQHRRWLCLFSSKRETGYCYIQEMTQNIIFVCLDRYFRKKGWILGNLIDTIFMNDPITLNSMTWPRKCVIVSHMSFDSASIYQKYIWRRARVLYHWERILKFVSCIFVHTEDSKIECIILFCCSSEKGLSNSHFWKNGSWNIPQRNSQQGIHPWDCTRERSSLDTVFFE